MNRKKIIRITTVPESLEKLLEGQLAFMNTHFEVVAISSDKMRLRKFAIKEGVRHYNIELTRKITPLNDLIAVWKLFWIFKKEKPFIVHSHTPKAGTVAMIAAKFARVPNRLYTIAGLPLLEVKGKKRVLLNFVEKITYKCATIIYPNSFGLKDIILASAFTRSNKLKVIGNGSSNGIDINFFSPSSISKAVLKKLRKELNISNEDFVFVFVGRIVKDKGINELLKAFNILSKKNDNIKLLLIGNREDDLNPITKKSNTIIKENTRIYELGYRKDVRPYFLISNILTFPSYREGFPNVVMQAGALGIPCIVSNINGCNEIISDGVNGIIIPPKNIEKLIEAMSFYINNKLKIEKMGRKSRELIVDNYCREKVWKALLNEYIQLGHVR